MAQSQTVTMLSIKEVAEITRLSEKTIHRYIRAGDLSAYRVNGRPTRIRSDDFEAFATARRLPVDVGSYLVAWVEPVLRSMLRRGDLEIGSNGAYVYMNRTEPDCKCGHSFSMHQRATDLHAHGCNPHCSCKGYDGPIVCIDCKTSLVQGRCFSKWWFAGDRCLIVNYCGDSKRTLFELQQMVV